MSFVTRPILCGGVGCGFEMRSQLPLALDSSARMNTAKAGCLAQWLGDTVGPTEATTDSTSKVVDDSHAEDCKKISHTASEGRFSSQEGHLAQMSLPYFSAKGEP